ncbi:C5a peptidase [Colletotrichum shisoi]|uniref:C5a peptidase n=1 Tax=Colletotrichum shisoi TaxID=2078593 RepID=A0A5Q4BBM6_9PEZI|nr:C5a peptidase [Colletotrichum shisoi]
MPRLSKILQSALVAIAAATPVVTATVPEGGFATGRNRLAPPASDAASGRYIVELEKSTGPNARHEDSSAADSLVGQISSLGYEATVKEDFTAISGRFRGVSVEITNVDNGNNKNSADSDSSGVVVDEIKSIPGVADAWPRWNPHIALDAGDSCNIAGSGSGTTAVLAKRGVCDLFQSFRSTANAGFGYGILFDSYNQGAYYFDDLAASSDTLQLMAVTTASVGEWASAQVAKNYPLHLKIESDAQPAAFAAEVPSAGQISSFTSWGPTYENGFSPIVSAPGGVVYGAFPDGRLAVSSGTSFATPYISGVAALWFAHVKKDRAEFVRRLTSTALALPAFDITDGKVVGGGLAASLAQQGAGLVDAAKLFDYTTVLLSEPTLSLNDTDNRVSRHTIRIQNTGPEEVTYNISHVAASTISSRNSIWYPNTYYPPLLSATGSLSEVKSVTVAAGASSDIEVTLTAPGVTAESGALWSGKILLVRSNDELLTVPYIGIEASTYNWTPLHHSPESYRYDQTDGSLYPIDYQGLAYRPAEFDSPEVYFAFRYGTYEFSVDLVGVDWKTEQFSYPPQHASGSRAWHGSVRFQSYEGGGYMDFPMREIVRFNLGTYTTFRSFANGTDIPSGRYRIFTRALRIFGDAADPADWQLFLSDPFSIQLGDDPIPRQN